MAITGPAVTMPSGPDAAGRVATLSLIALPATPATPPHAHNRRRGALPAVSGKYAGHGYDLASVCCGAGLLFWFFLSSRLVLARWAPRRRHPTRRWCGTRWAGTGRACRYAGLVAVSGPAWCRLTEPNKKEP